MKRDILRESLIDALSYCSVRELPPESNGEDVYIRAIALTSKRNGSKGYAVLDKDKNGNDKVVKDFGDVSQIAKIDKVYPVLYLDSSYIPDIKKKEDKVRWVQLQNGNPLCEEMSIKELNKEILRLAIRNQLNNIR